MIVHSDFVFLRIFFMLKRLLLLLQEVAGRTHTYMS